MTNDLRTPPTGADEPSEALVDALRHFQSWSNLLVATTGVVLGLIGANGAAAAPWVIATVTLLLATSAVLGVLTLALVPHVREHLDAGHASIYRVGVRPEPLGFPLVWFDVKLPHLCLPQHVTLMVALGLYAGGISARVL